MRITNHNFELLHVQAVPQGGASQPCVACKIRKKQNRLLKEQLTELDKEYHLLYNAKIKLETQLETLQDQLQREDRERQHVTSTIVVPKLQEVITLLERSNAVAEISGAQQTLKRMNDLMHEQTRHDVPRRKFRSQLGYSMLSLFSDTSSVVDVAGEEETARQNGATSDTNTIPTPQNGTDPDKSTDTSMNPTKVKARSKEKPHSPASKELLKTAPFQLQEDVTASEQVKEVPQKSIRSDSTPASHWSKSHSAPGRKLRHHSVSGASEKSHEDLSQSLKVGERKRKMTCPPISGSQAYRDELQSKLDKQLKKIESQSIVRTT